MKNISYNSITKYKRLRNKSNKIHARTLWNKILYLFKGILMKTKRKIYRYTMFKDKKTKFHEDIYPPQFDL